MNPPPMCVPVRPSAWNGTALTLLSSVWAINASSLRQTINARVMRVVFEQNQRRSQRCHREASGVSVPAATGPVKLTHTSPRGPHGGSRDNKSAAVVSARGIPHALRWFNHILDVDAMCSICSPTDIELGAARSRICPRERARDLHRRIECCFQYSTMGWGNSTPI